MHGLICTSTLSWPHALYVKPFYALCGFIDPLSPLAWFVDKLIDRMNDEVNKIGDYS